MPPDTPTLPSGYRLLAFDEIGSTNAEGMRLAGAGECGPLWIWAKTQTLGRGRSGRSWISVPGNLYASLLIRLDCAPTVLHQLSFVAGVATYDAIRAAGSAAGKEINSLRLKWPNDVLIEDAKLAGILLESTTQPGASGASIAVIGIGINLAGHPEGIGRAVTHLAAHGISISPAAMLQHLATAMNDWLKRWDNGVGFPLLREAWLQRAGIAGEQMTINTGRETVEGSFIGIDAQGALVLRDVCGVERRFTYGDVTLGMATGASGRR
ncbi:MAG: biotin--[acetyl-CoA-carboxylase] ligase [Proteobacteria bacterium]|jgi:birA, biotin-[acetyl-CoA-carboxylase] ligase region|nr:MAG: biotin--[acetyl-CoA-carboxylase] ligase [Pseudomonadota bacterium]